jgi:hypothetical protein
MQVTWVLLLVACAACKAKEPPPPPPVTPEEKPAIPIEKPSRIISSPLPEKGPHPEYPTAAAAGTDKLFFIEEPDRGPPAPATYTMPPRGSLAWTVHPYCEVDAVSAPCTNGKAPSIAKWRVGRAKGVTIVEQLRGTIVSETWVFLTNDAGAPKQQLHIDGYGIVDEALHFTQPGRYTARKRSGGNGLAGCGMEAYVLDKAKRIVELSCLQWLGEPMRDTYGVAVRKYTYDARGLVATENRFGLDGAPIASIDGVHEKVYTRDAIGRLTLTESFDVAGQPVVDTEGCAKERFVYGAAGMAERSTCLGTDNQPAEDGEGVAIRTYRYDAAGCWIDVRHLDERGRPEVDHDGIHGQNYEVDEHCATKTQTCIGPAKTPIACGLGKAAKTVNTIDARGYTTSVKHFNADGTPSTDSQYDVHEVRYVYDDAGHSTEVRCFAHDGEAAECGSTGFHGYRKTSDDAGRVTVETFFNQRGAPATNLGVSQRRFRYDNYDHRFESLSLDPDGNVIETHGMAIRRTLWDATHRVFAIHLLDAKGNPARYTACYVSATCPEQPWHAVRIYRRPNGRVSANQFFDADGQWMETIDCADQPCFDGN